MFARVKRVRTIGCVTVNGKLQHGQGSVCIFTNSTPFGRLFIQHKQLQLCAFSKEWVAPNQKFTRKSSLG